MSLKDNIINITLYSLGSEEIATFEYQISESEIKQKRLNDIFYEKTNLLYKKIKDYKNVSSRNPHEIKFVPFYNTEIVLTEYEDIFLSKYSEFIVIYEQIDRDRYLLLTSRKKRLCNYSEDFNYGFGCDCYKCKIEEIKIAASHRLEKRIETFFNNLKI
jgi:hypothetical protein